MLLLLDCDECGFNDLGTLMIAGVTVAFLVGIVLTVIRLRLRAKRPASSSEFLSIKPSRD